MPAHVALHGRDHCPGGADPIPCMFIVVGERYKTTNQSINDSSFTEVTSWDHSTIQDETIISEQTNGLGVEVAGFYIVSARADWDGIGTSPVNAAITIEVGIAATGETIDEFSSQTFNGDTGSRTSHVTDITYIEAGKIVTVFAYHESGSSRAVNPVTLKLVKLLSTPNDPDGNPVVPYWVPN